MNDIARSMVALIKEKDEIIRELEIAAKDTSELDAANRLIASQKGVIAKLKDNVMAANNSAAHKGQELDDLMLENKEIMSTFAGLQEKIDELSASQCKS